MGPASTTTTSLCFLSLLLCCFLSFIYFVKKQNSKIGYLAGCSTWITYQINVVNKMMLSENGFSLARSCRDKNSSINIQQLVRLLPPHSPKPLFYILLVLVSLANSWRKYKVGGCHAMEMDENSWPRAGFLWGFSDIGFPLFHPSFVYCVIDSSH